MTFRNSYVHHNFCLGIWEDINAANNEIAFNRVVNNTHEGIFYEISTSARIHDNTVSGSGSTGAAADNGANLALRNIQFVTNSLLSGARFCGLSC
ncbi:MAG TPA: hypothetical protein DEV93_21955 [Chloroflexi bacterium]|nr:hypothetical protein [Chloroflexota bacterium]